MANAEYRDGTPTAAGVYAVNGFKDVMRRHWAPATGWSCCWYADEDDPEYPEFIERAKRTPADRDNVASIRWCEVAELDALAAAYHP